MDCQFCTEFTTPQNTTRIITTTNEGWVLLPTLGCLTPGYCLFMPLDHIDAAADLTTDALPVVATRIEEMRALIQARYGPTILAEHGPRGCDRGASCCSHCHLHLIPTPDPDAVTRAYENTGGPAARLASFTDLSTTARGSYLYLSPRPDEHLIWPSAGFPRQFVRRVCAHLLGCGTLFDWRDHPLTTNRDRTHADLTADLRPAHAA